MTDDIKTSSIGRTSSAKTSYGYTAKDKECLARAMFFESNRSSRDGLVAVGTVVMNRLQSGAYGDSVCEVVGQKGQFAPGVLSRKMESKALPDVIAAADSVLKGERHPGVKNAMFFHTAGLRFPYKNMHYVLVAGGNAFYEKRSRHRRPELPAATGVASAAQPQPVATAIPRDTTVTQQSASAEISSPATAQRELSYAADKEALDAIGAVIAAEGRPLVKVD
ncbi:cell wall hydrolase [Mesorhizobium sp. KR2-14]|uniref:cell wall hydrolase n=1 Tax=Mesorhizobium sp. KR2-14 TaxID=3156610 RepID=UPI0032B51829